jgi:hypothetical protein
VRGRWRSDLRLCLRFLRLCCCLLCYLLGCAPVMSVEAVDCADADGGTDSEHDESASDDLEGSHSGWLGSGR